MEHNKTITQTDRGRKNSSTGLDYQALKEFSDRENKDFIEQTKELINKGGFLQTA